MTKREFKLYLPDVKVKYFGKVCSASLSRGYNDKYLRIKFNPFIEDGYIIFNKRFDYVYKCYALGQPIRF